MQPSQDNLDPPDGRARRNASAAAAVFDAAVAGLHEPFVVLDHDERLIAWNPAYANLHRDAGGPCILEPGMTIAAVTQWRLSNNFFHATPAASPPSEAENPAHYEAKGALIYRLGDGRWMLVQRYPLPDGRNVGLWIDISELKRIEAALADTRTALQAANEALERRVTERTEALIGAQDALLKQEKLSAIGQLTATVAHELRNPMSAIKNTVFALKESAGAGAALERPLTRIERSVARCDKIIEELLDYSRSRELRCERCPFDAWLREIAAEFATPPEIAIAFELGAGEASVDLDAERLRRVVINLVDNAAQALAESEKEAPRILIQSHASSEQVELVIADNGPGIAPDHLAKVFEPLFTTKRFGTGLGLPTVKQIVEQHGGTIVLESVLGEHTRAIIRLPRIAD